MVHLIEIKGLFDEKYCMIDMFYEKGNVSVIVGANGAGKSTILNIIDNPEKYKNLYDSITFYDEEEPDEIERDYISTLLIRSYELNTDKKSLFRFDDINTIENYIIKTINDIIQYFFNFKNIEYINHTNNDIDKLIEFELNTEEIVRKFLDDYGFKKTEYSTQVEINDSNFTDLVFSVINRSEEVMEAVKKVYRIEYFLETVNSFLVNKKIYIFDRAKMYYMQYLNYEEKYLESKYFQEDDLMELNTLSSGEKNIITLIAQIIFLDDRFDINKDIINNKKVFSTGSILKMETLETELEKFKEGTYNTKDSEEPDVLKRQFRNSEFKLILIDEPENTLHVAWQRRYINTINTIIKDLELDIQVLIVTHSPNIIACHEDIVNVIET